MRLVGLNLRTLEFFLCDYQTPNRGVFFNDGNESLSPKRRETQ